MASSGRHTAPHTKTTLPHQPAQLRAPLTDYPTRRVAARRPSSLTDMPTQVRPAHHRPHPTHADKPPRLSPTQVVPFLAASCRQPIASLFITARISSRLADSPSQRFSARPISPQSPAAHPLPPLADYPPCSEPVATRADTTSRADLFLPPSRLPHPRRHPVPHPPRARRRNPRPADYPARPVTPRPVPIPAQPTTRAPRARTPHHTPALHLPTPLLKPVPPGPSQPHPYRLPVAPQCDPIPAFPCRLRLSTPPVPPTQPTTQPFPLRARPTTRLSPIRT